MDPRTRQYRLPLAAILIAGCSLRLMLAVKPTFFEEEVGPVARGAMSTAEILLISLRDGLSPLFAMAVHAAMRLAQLLGKDHATLQTLRLLPLAAGVASLVLVARAARDWWGESASLAAACLLAFLPSHLLGSSILAVEAPLQFLLLAGTLLWIQLARTDSAPAKKRFGLAAGFAFFMSSALALDLRSLVFWPLFWLDSRLRPQTPAEGAAPRRRPRFLLTASLLPFVVWRIFLNARAGRIIPARDSVIDAFLLCWPVFPEASPFPEPANPTQTGLALFGLLLLAGVFILALSRLTAHLLREPHGSPHRPLFTLALIVGGLSAIQFYPPARVLGAARLAPLVIPFGILFAARLLTSPELADGVVRIAPLRKLALASTLLAGLWAAFVWPQGRDSPTVLPYLRPAHQAVPGDTIAFTNEKAAPWLRRAGSYRFVSPSDAFDPDKIDPARPVWFVTHNEAAYPGSLQTPEAAMLNRILRTAPGVIEAPILPVWRQWQRISVVQPELIPALAKRLHSAMKRLSELRDESRDGQVFLPDDPEIQFGKGWGAPERSSDAQLYCWSIGDNQSIDWYGPKTPGTYRLTVDFYRPQPYPTLIYTMQYRLPGDTEWKSLLAGLNAIRIAGDIRVENKRQPLKVEFRIPSWKPSIIIPFSTDSREIGIQLTRVELAPVP